VFNSCWVVRWRQVQVVLVPVWWCCWRQYRFRGWVFCSSGQESYVFSRSCRCATGGIHIRNKTLFSLDFFYHHQLRKIFLNHRFVPSSFFLPSPIFVGFMSLYSCIWKNFHTTHLTTLYLVLVLLVMSINNSRRIKKLWY